MRYIAIIHKDGDSAYGVTLPDFPGVFSAADAWDELAGNIQEAVELWADGQEVEPPAPSPFETVVLMEEAKDGVLMLVDVDFGFLDSRAVPVNITMPVYLRARLDRAAREKGLTRSGLIQVATRDYINRMACRDEPVNSPKNP
ncbi:MAG: type II toxin-antitoxin system HicB family antitoxin [Deltaproteobacteria bacterium]|jgi:predicted RNase H-like HicB family nuclease|nr:type II toxin-antitoxin system HicB family antitoxin [Deltaproteobacteria bacterium]